MAIRPEIEIKPHQVQGADFMLRHNYVICADEQGLGKTLEAIIVQQASGLDCLVICPATLKYNWLEEYEKFTDEKSVKVGLKKAKVNIINYENVYKCTELFMKAGIVIIDESHYLIHLDAQRTQYVHRMVEKYKPERLILLTGTPVKNRVTDFYSLLRLCSYTPVPNNGRSILDKFPSQVSFNNYFAYKETFSKRIKLKRGGSFTKKITKYSGLKKDNESELKAFMRFKYIRRVASKVLDLPPVIFKDVVASYKEDKELWIDWLKHEQDENFDSRVKANAAKLNAPFTADYIKDLIDGDEGPIVCFSDHIAPLAIIEERLKKKRYKVAVITGNESNMRKRQDLVNSFQAGEIDVILLTYGAGATGLNLTRSRNMVLNDESWDASAMSQAFKRIDRIGQTRTPIIHRVLGTSTAKKINESLRLKMRDIDRII